MAMTIDKARTLFDQIETTKANLAPLPVGQNLGGLTFAGNLWPNDSKRSLREHDVNQAVGDARAMITQGILKAKAALRDDEEAVAVMTRWFGPHDITDRDWWQGVVNVLAILDHALTQDVQAFYRGDASIIGQQNDYPTANPGDLLVPYDIVGFAESMPGTQDSVVGFCQDFFDVDVSTGGEYRGHNVSLRGQNSVGGILVHELSHNLAATKDVNIAGVGTCYGDTTCRNQAIAHPEFVWCNADSIEYFCEDVYSH